MKKLIVLLGVIYLSNFTQTAYTQSSISDSLFSISTVEVYGNRLSEQSGSSNIQKIDSLQTILYQSKSLAQLLSDATGVSVQMYGPSGLATMSVRGGGSSHSAVIWNGINLQSPMNGGVNLSTIPMALIGNISVQYGGSGTLFGSGNLSGAVHLNQNNFAKKSNEVTLASQIGSFGERSINGTVKLGGESHNVLFNGIYKQADNNFSFKNTAKYKHPIEEQTNAQMKQNGYSADYLWDINEAFKLGVSALYTHNDVHIPTQMTSSSENNSTQIDNNFLSAINFKYRDEKNSINFKNGFISNEIFYNNPSLVLYTKNQSQSLVNEIEFKRSIFKHQSITIGINNSYEKAESDAYQSLPHRHRMSFFGFYNINAFHQKLNWNISARQESINNENIPLVYASGISYDINKWLSIKSNASKTYRIPTFNDLYWIEAGAKGNPLLQPENGISADATLEQKLKLGTQKITFSETLFMAQFKNWIVWLPDSTNTWTPTNKEEGESKGLEMRCNWSNNWGKAIVTTTLNYTYTQSVIKSKDEYNQKPMLYVPKHKASINGSLEIAKFSALLQINYTGERNYDAYNTLDQYLLSNLHLSRKITFLKCNGAISGHINNLTNSAYQVMAWYAMPLRNYALSISITI